MADKRIRVHLEAMTGAYQQKMGEASKATQHFGDNVNRANANTEKLGASTAWKKVASSIKVTGAAWAATALFKGGQRLVGIDDAQAKLRGLGHDAESVEKIMDSALASVKGTAYGLADAATTAATAVAAGIQPGQELTKYLTLTADAATIAGIGMNEMGSIMNKVTTGGRAMTENLNQLADRGIPIFTWLQEEYGVTADALREMVSRGEVDATTFRRVIEENIGGAAQESGESIRGTFNNMIAAVGRLGAAFLGPGFGSAKDALGSITEGVDGLTDKVGPAVEGVLDLIRKFGDLPTPVKDFAIAVGVLATASWFLSGAWAAISVTATWGSIVGMAGTIGAFTTLVWGAATAATGVAASFGAASTAAWTLLGALGPVGIAIGVVAGAWALYRRRQRQATEEAEAFLDAWRRGQDLDSLGGVGNAIEDLEGQIAELRPIVEDKWAIRWFGDVEDDKKKLEGLENELERISETSSIFNQILEELDPDIRAVAEAMGVEAVTASDEYNYALYRGLGRTEALDTATRLLAGSTNDAAVAAQESAEYWEAFGDVFGGNIEAVDTFMDNYSTRLSDMNEAGRAAAAEHDAIWEDIPASVEAAQQAINDTLIEQEEFHAFRMRLLRQYGPEEAQAFAELYAENRELGQAFIAEDTSEFEEYFNGRQEISQQAFTNELTAQIEQGVLMVNETGEWSAEMVATLADNLNMSEGEVRDALDAAKAESEVQLALMAGAFETGGEDALTALMGQLDLAPDATTSVLEMLNGNVDAQMAVLETVMRTGSEEAVDAALRALNQGASEAELVAARYAAALAMGLNPVIASIGGKAIYFSSMGDVQSYASSSGQNVAMADGGTLPSEARVQGPGTLVQWAEPETGGEAFIPLSPSKRGRSLAIWEQVGRQFGILNSFAQGGFRSASDIPNVPDMSRLGSFGDAGSQLMGHTRKEALKYIESMFWGDEGGAVTANGRGGLGPAARRARDSVRENFGFSGTIGGYSNRNIAGTNRLSKHALGKAIDVMTMSNMALGQRIANYFQANRQSYGVDNIIWNRQINSGRGWNRYNGVNPHRDHPHIDFYNNGGLRLPIGSYDSGGHLPPGLSIAHNGTGRPEPVGHNLGVDYDKLAAVLSKSGKNVYQTINGAPERNTLVEARHQARIALLEMK